MQSGVDATRREEASVYPFPRDRPGNIRFNSGLCKQIWEGVRRDTHGRLGAYFGSVGLRRQPNIWVRVPSSQPISSVLGEWLKPPGTSVPAGRPSGCPPEFEPRPRTDSFKQTERVIPHSEKGFKSPAHPVCPESMIKARL